MSDASVSPFAEFGMTEELPLNRAQRLAGANLARTWSTIPHVTHHDEADVTSLETLRRAMRAQSPDSALTALPFYVRAVAQALKIFPKFNSSLNAGGDTLILKKYINIGIAVDTPRGLLVPVVRDVDKKPIKRLAYEISCLAGKARAKGLSMADLSGGCITISSLGKTGGVAFTPIINAPEVAILGISRIQERPVRQSGQLAWIQCLPLSLSYDHRVINGAEAASFVSYLTSTLAAPDSEWV